MRPTIHVSLLTFDFPPIPGGISHYLYHLVKFMPDINFNIAALDTSNANIFDKDRQLSIKRIKGSVKFLAPAYLAALTKHPTPSAVWCGQAHYSLLFPTWLYSKIHKIPYVVTGYGFDLWHPQTKPYKLLFNYLLRQAKLLIADSNYAASFNKVIGGLDQKTTVIYPSIDTRKSISSSPSPEILQKKLGLEGKKCLMTVGRLVARKGHDIVIKSLPEILSVFPNVHYLIIGDGNNKTQLQELIRNLGIEAHVTFIGYISDEELESYYQLCDIFLMISRSIIERGDVEGFGIVYLEAGLRAKPIIAGRSGGVPEAVVDGVTGILVDPNDNHKVAEAVKYLLQNPDTAHKFGENGKNRVIEEFDIRTTANKMQSLLFNTIGNS